MLKKNRLVIAGSGGMDGTTPLGGSATPLLAMLGNYVAWGFDLCAALKMSTLVPARIIGETTKGLLRVGNDADLVLMDGRAKLAATIIQGKVVFTAEPSVISP